MQISSFAYSWIFIKTYFLSNVRKHITKLSIFKAQIIDTTSYNLVSVIKPLSCKSIIDLLQLSTLV